MKLKMTTFYIIMIAVGGLLVVVGTFGLSLSTGKEDDSRHGELIKQGDVIKDKIDSSTSSIDIFLKESLSENIKESEKIIKDIKGIEAKPKDNLISISNSPGAIITKNHTGNLTVINNPTYEATDIINSVEILLYLDDLNTKGKISEIETNIVIQSAVAFFSQNERYRFVTDYQFSCQQIDTNIRRGILKFKPEDPSQIIGKKINLLNSFETFGYNFSDFTKYFGFAESSQTQLLSFTLLVNGVKIVVIENILHKNGQIYSGQLNLDLKSIFKNIDIKYKSIISK